MFVLKDFDILTLIFPRIPVLIGLTRRSLVTLMRDRSRRTSLMQPRIYGKLVLHQSSLHSASVLVIAAHL